MSSNLFREELERVVSDSLRDSGADGISNLLTEMSVKQVKRVLLSREFPDICINLNNIGDGH